MSDEGQVPWATFTSPEVGRVGMTESEAADHGGRVAYLPMTEVDRAVASGQTRGFQACGRADAGRRRRRSPSWEPVHGVAPAMRTNMFTGRLAQTVHTYPTWSMAVQKAAAQFFCEIEGRAARPARR